MVAALAPVAIPAAVNAAIGSVTNGLGAIENFATRFPASATLTRETRVAVALARDRLDEALGKLEGLRQLSGEAMATTQRDKLERALNQLDITAEWLREEVQGLGQQLDAPADACAGDVAGTVVAQHHVPVAAADTDSQPRKLTCCGCLRMKPRWAKHSANPVEQAYGVVTLKYREVQLAGLQQASEALKAAGDAVQERVQQLVTIGRRVHSLYYQVPRQLQQVMEALTSDTELVIVTGGPAMGKSSLAREVMRQIHLPEVCSFCPACNRSNIAPAGYVLAFQLRTRRVRLPSSRVDHLQPFWGSI
jgi:hypothetical protein